MSWMQHCDPFPTIEHMYSGRTGVAAASSAALAPKPKLGSASMPVPSQHGMPGQESTSAAAMIVEAIASGDPFDVDTILREMDTAAVLADVANETLNGKSPSWGGNFQGTEEEEDLEDVTLSASDDGGSSSW
jgi:hypothetical protein